MLRLKCLKLHNFITGVNYRCVSRAYPSGDVDSDHNPVIAKFQLSLKRNKKPKSIPKFDFTSLKKNLDTKRNFKTAVINNIPASTDYQRVVDAIQEAAAEHIPTVEKRKPSSHWFNQELKDLLHKRRISKTNPVQYRLVQQEFRKKCRESKEAWLEEKCREVENKSHNAKEMYAKIKEITGKRSNPPPNCIKAADGRILHKIKDVATRWEEYVQDLFDDDQETEEIIPVTSDSGPTILKSEVSWALRMMKTGKAAGPDRVYIEMLHALDEEGVEIVWKIATEVYESGCFPQDMLKSIFITLPKIPGTLDCANYRTISLMSHILKVLLKIILQRIRRQLLPEIPRIQFGFMKDRSTINAIFTLRMLGERAIQHQQDVFLVFIDYQKAFDKVRHCELFKILSKIKVDEKDMRIVRALYRDQRAAVRLSEGTTNWFSIKRGVRQGCVMSPDLFNLYSEMILRDLEDRPEGIIVNGVKINNLRYADDTVLLASSAEDLQKIFDVVVAASAKLGQHVNAKKTKTMVISKLEIPPACQIQHQSTTITQINYFNYLGSVVTSDARCKKEIRRRISLAKDAFSRLRNILTDRKLSKKIKVRLLKAYVWSTLLYGCEAWTFTKETRRNIEAAEMWFYRRMLRISYMDRITNEEVLNQMERKRELLDTIRERQLKFLGHQVRKEGIEMLALTGRVEGKRARGGQRLTFLQNFDTHPVSLLQSARERTSYKQLVRQTPLR